MNPFFNLHDKLKNRFASLAPGYNIDSIRTAVSESILQVVDSDISFHEMNSKLFARAKVFFSPLSSDYMFTVWAMHQSIEDILFIVERTGLLYEERDLNTAKNPFKALLELIDDPRVKLDFLPFLEEFEVTLNKTICEDYGLATCYVDEIRRTLPIVLSDIVNTQYSTLQKDEALEILKQAIIQCYPDVMKPEKRSITFSSLFNDIPFDFDALEKVLLTASTNADEMLTPQLIGQYYG